MNVTTLNMKTWRGYEEIRRHGVNITRPEGDEEKGNIRGTQLGQINIMTKQEEANWTLNNRLTHEPDTGVLERPTSEGARGTWETWMKHNEGKMETRHKDEDAETQTHREGRRGQTHKGT